MRAATRMRYKHNAAGAATWAASVLTDTPLAWLRLNEVSGTNAADSSGNGRNGTHQAGPTLNVAGKGTDKAVSYPGPNVFTSLDIAAVGAGFTTASTSAAESWAVEIVLKVASIPGSTGYAISVGRSTSGNPICGIDCLTGTGALNGGYRLDDGTTVQSIGSATNYADNAWHHAVFESDGTTVTLYVDNVSTASATAVTGATATFDRASVANLHRSTDANFLACVVDEAAWYDHALGATRVAAHYAALAGI